MHFPSDLSEKCWCFCNNCFNLVCSCIQSNNFPKLATLNLQEPKFIEPQISKKTIMSCSMLIITWKATTCLRYYLRNYVYRKIHWNVNVFDLCIEALSFLNWIRVGWLNSFAVFVYSMFSLIMDANNIFLFVYEQSWDSSIPK